MYTKNLKTISFHFGRKGSTNQRDAFKELVDFEVRNTFLT